MKKILLLFLFFVCSLSANAIQEETLILFDSSVSMLEPFGKFPKYILAVKEAKKVLSNYDETKQIGLRIIGISIESAMDYLAGEPENFCKATKLVAPITYRNIEYINTKLDMIFPLGTTPLTYSLNQAIENDFTPSSYKHIILITDGGESCNANPCNYIREIMATRSDIKIDIIAIGVSNNELEDLNCLVSATSGELFNAKRPDDISTALNKILEKSSVTPTINSQSFDNTIIQTVPVIIDNEPEIRYKNYLLVE